MPAGDYLCQICSSTIEFDTTICPTCGTDFRDEENKKGRVTTALGKSKLERDREEERTKRRKR